MSSYISIGAAILLIWLVKRLVDFWSISKQRYPFPPGPKPKPVIGNLTDIPTTNAAHIYAQWEQKYQSNILDAAALGDHVIVLNNREDAEELLEKRASNYSDRPVLPIIETMGWGYNIALYGHGDKWRFHRKICQQNFRPEGARRYQPLLTKLVHNMLQNLLDSPDNFDDHNKMLSISIPMMTMYGYEVKSFEDPCIVVAERSLALAVRLLMPGATLINIFPVLAYIPSWFPGASSHKVAAEVKRLTLEMGEIPMKFVKECMAEGTAIPSLVSDLLERKNSAGVSKEEEEAVKNIALAVYSGASDTTISATGTFFYAMAINPDVQRKAQAEIDHVTGSKRLPEYKDRPFLPYVEAIYREVMRFRPPLELGLPHNVSEDDHYKGYVIPKAFFQLRFFANIWAMTHDEKVYPEPFKFNPERFFDENGNLNDDRILAYGFGRRICVGKHVASSIMWLIIASVLASFDISEAKDESGNDIEISGDYEDLGLITHKTKFQCSITPRSVMARQLIQEREN